MVLNAVAIDAIELSREQFRTKNGRVVRDQYPALSGGQSYHGPPRRRRRRRRRQ